MPKQSFNNLLKIFQALAFRDNKDKEPKGPLPEGVFMVPYVTESGWTLEEIVDQMAAVESKKQRR